MVKALQVLSGFALVATLVLSVGAINVAFMQTAAAQRTPPPPPPPSPTRGVPGPIAGAGIPVAIIGFGAYWLVRRYRRK
jgi:hypothetical protein